MWKKTDSSSNRTLSSYAGRKINKIVILQGGNIAHARRQIVAQIGS